MSAVTTLLERHGLSVPDGRPLFGYHLEPAELADLLAELRASSFRVREASAAFCLAAAEIWRRVYDGGAWSWDTILNEMRWPAVTPLGAATARSHGARLLASRSPPSRAS